MERRDAVRARLLLWWVMSSSRGVPATALRSDGRAMRTLSRRADKLLAHGPPPVSKQSVPRREPMFYRIIRELNDGRLYYMGGAAGDRASWTDLADNAKHYRSADQSARVGATIAALTDGGRVGVEAID